MLPLLPIIAQVAAMPSPLVGLYESSTPEVGAGLELLPDGRFRYALDYGAVSEIAEGRWTSDGRTVRLTSDPMPRAPSFAIVKDEPAPPGELWVNLEPPGFDWGGPLEFMATIDGSGQQVRIKPAASGKVAGAPGRILAIRPIVPVYGDVGPPLPLIGANGHKLTVRFVRNDLGKARFAGQPLAIENSGLRLDRYETSIRFVRSAPPR